MWFMVPFVSSSINWCPRKVIYLIVGKLCNKTTNSLGIYTGPVKFLLSNEHRAGYKIWSGWFWYQERYWVSYKRLLSCLGTVFGAFNFAGDGDEGEEYHRWKRLDALRIFHNDDNGSRSWSWMKQKQGMAMTVMRSMYIMSSLLNSEQS